jgi:ribosomal protein S16
MLAIRMQRTGRKGHAMFRVVVQDARVTPTSGKVVALLGNYDPHSKVANIDKDKAATYLKNGARPSDRVALLLQREGIELPKWVTVNTNKSGKIRNPESCARTARPSRRQPLRKLLPTRLQPRTSRKIRKPRQVIILKT